MTSLSDVALARNVLEQRKRNRAAADQRVRALRRDLADVERVAGPGATITRLRKQLEVAEEKLTDADRVLSASTGEVDKIRAAVFEAMNKPDAAIESLDGQVPLVLLPVRIETRFFDNELRVRVFPDVIHIDQHEPLLTDEEQAAARDWWTERWKLKKTAEIEALWADATATGSPNRVTWAIRETTPLNIADLPSGEPKFPKLTLRARGMTGAPVARALPERWLVIGVRDGVEVVRKWGSPITEDLPMGPAPEADVDHAAVVKPDVQNGLPVDPALEWLTNFDEAVTHGMGLSIKDQDLASGKVATGFDELIVVGLDWSRTPEAGATLLSDLLDAHLHTRGASFVTPGTPTNASAEELPPRPSPAPDPSASPSLPSSSAAQVLAEAFGISPEAPGRLDGAEATINPHDRDMITALWEPTIGYFLRQMMEPVFTDTQINGVRNHMRQHVRARGPLPHLRIGRQPYGILPVTPTARFAGAGFEGDIADGLRKLRPFWTNHIGASLQLGASGDPAADLLSLLGQTERSAEFRVRQVLGPALAASSETLGALGNLQTLLAQLTMLLVGITERPFLVDATILDDAAVLPVPLVQPADLSETAGLAQNYIATIASRTTQSGGFVRLLQDPDDATSLLEALLLHGASVELSRASLLSVLDGLKLSEMTEGGAVLNEREISGVGEITSATLGAGAATARATGATTASTARMRTAATVVGSREAELLSMQPAELATSKVREISGGRTLVNHIAAMSNGELRRVVFGRQLSEFRASLDRLKDVPSAELARLTADTLDLASFRLDAWCTSMATRRLDTVRRKTPIGSHVGGFGWVQNLKPSAEATSLGHIHGPSIAHAATAAILRSGHLSHSGADADELAIDLSSARVRHAMAVLDGVRSGQSIGALLGYRFERALRDRGPLFAQYILPFRQHHPLAESVDRGDETGPVEAIAARNVVDGAVLSELTEAELDATITSVGVASSRRSAVRAEVADLRDIADAVADVLMSESVFQAVMGNTERSAAALDALDRQTGLPDLGVTRTPRTGRRCTHRVLLSFSTQTAPGVWASLVDNRSDASPEVNAWVATALGDPKRYVFTAVALNEAGAVVAKPKIALADMGLSALSAVVATARGSEQLSELEERIAVAFAEQVPADAVELRDDVGPAGTIGLRGFTWRAGRMLNLLSSARPATARDVASDATWSEVDPGIDLGELEVRATAAAALLSQVARTLDGITERSRVSTMTKALQAAADLGARGALPRSDVQAELFTQVRVVQRALVRRAAQVNRHVRALPNSASDTDVAAHWTKVFALVFGDDFPVVPSCALPSAVAGELGASFENLADQKITSTSVPAWVFQHSVVRPSTARLQQVIEDSEALDLLDESLLNSGQFRVAQLPHAPNDPWVGAQLIEPGRHPVANLSITIHDVAGTENRPPVTSPMRALVIDQWSDLIPNPTETTGVAFHFDAPGARPPQAVLVAAPPDPEASSWTTDVLVDTVRDALEIARLRTLDIDTLEIARFLPALYFAFNLERKTPSLNFGVFVESSLAAIAALNTEINR